MERKIYKMRATILLRYDQKSSLHTTIYVHTQKKITQYIYKGGVFFSLTNFVHVLKLHK